MDIRRRVDGHANLDQIGLTGIHSRLGAAVRLRLPPHAPSRDRAVALGSQLPPTGPVGDLHPPSVIHVQRTRSPYGLPAGPPKLVLSLCSQTPPCDFSLIFTTIRCPRKP